LECEFEFTENISLKERTQRRIDQLTQSNANLSAILTLLRSGSAEEAAITLEWIRNAGSVETLAATVLDARLLTSAIRNGTEQQSDATDEIGSPSKESNKTLHTRGFPWTNKRLITSPLRIPLASAYNLDTDFETDLMMLSMFSKRHTLILCTTNMSTVRSR
jgi:hypothetical protein